eukprot:2682583-Prymnesium_polylepis.2
MENGSPSAPTRGAGQRSLPRRAGSRSRSPARPGGVAPAEGLTYDPITKTSTFTLANAPACYTAVANQPCIGKSGFYSTIVASPSPPPSPPTPPPPSPRPPLDEFGIWLEPSPPPSPSPPDIRLWSEASSWGGVMPKRGDTVLIPEGVRVILDMTPPVSRSIRRDALPSL